MVYLIHIFLIHLSYFTYGCSLKNFYNNSPRNSIYIHRCLSQMIRCHDTKIYYDDYFIGTSENNDKIIYNNEKYNKDDRGIKNDNLKINFDNVLNDSDININDYDSNSSFLINDGYINNDDKDNKNIYCPENSNKYDGNSSNKYDGNSSNNYDDNANTSYRYVMKICYDGSDFSGFQYQSNKRSIQGVLNEILSAYYDTEIKACGASRTGTCISMHAYSTIY